MSTKKQAVKKAAKPAAEDKVTAAKVTRKAVEPTPHDPVYLNTQWGAVPVFGHEYVAKKTLDTIGQMLVMSDAFAEGDHGVRGIVMRTDGYPIDPKKKTARLGQCDIDTGTFALNLMHIASRGIAQAMDRPTFSIEANIHQAILVTALHETHHLSMLFNDGPERQKFLEGKASFLKELETMADEWSLATMIALAKVVDLEPAHISESPFFAAQLMELLSSGDSDFIKHQRWMHENHILFHKRGTSTTEDVSLHTFKEVCHILSGDDLDDPTWLQPTIPVPMGMKAATIEVTTEPSVSVTTQPAPAAEAPAQPEYVEQGYAFEEDFDTSGAEYCDDDPYYGPSVNVAPAAPAPVQTTQVAPVVQPQTRVMPGMAPVAQQPVVLATGPAPAAAPVPMQGPVQVYPDHGIPRDQFIAAVKSVMDKCVYHIFTHCGRPQGFPGYDYNPGDRGPGQPGHVVNAENVLRMPIMLTELERTVVVKCDCYDANGRWCPGTLTSTGELRGWVAKNAKIPMYKLYINDGGFEVLRTVIPQNPANGKYQQMARDGHYIAYVFDGRDKAAGEKGDLKRKYVDGAWQEI